MMDVSQWLITRWWMSPNGIEESQYNREFARSENTYLLNILCYMIELCSKLNCGNFTISVCIALVSELTGPQRVGLQTDRYSSSSCWVQMVVSIKSQHKTIHLRPSVQVVNVVVFRCCSNLCSCALSCCSSLVLFLDVVVVGVVITRFKVTLVLIVWLRFKFGKLDWEQRW